MLKNKTPKKAELASNRMESKSENLKRIRGCIRVGLREKAID